MDKPPLEDPRWGVPWPAGLLLMYACVALVASVAVLGVLS